MQGLAQCLVDSLCPGVDLTSLTAAYLEVELEHSIVEVAGIVQEAFLAEAQDCLQAAQLKLELLVAVDRLVAEELAVADRLV